MTTEVDIPGGKATLRDAKDLKVRYRRLVEKAGFNASGVLQRLPDGIEKLKPQEQADILKDLKLDGDDLERLNAVQDAAILALLDSWTLDIPVPKTADELTDIPGSVYDALAEATRLPGSEIASKSFAPTPDQSSPTGPSGGSATA